MRPVPVAVGERVRFDDQGLEAGLWEDDLRTDGDLQACLKRIVELNDLHRSSTPGTLIHGFATWRSRRLPGGGF